MLTSARGCPNKALFTQQVKAGFDLLALICLDLEQNKGEADIINLTLASSFQKEKAGLCLIKHLDLLTIQ